MTFASAADGAIFKAHLASDLGSLWFCSVSFGRLSSMTTMSCRANAQWAVETLCNLLGFKFSKEGSKASPFSSIFQMLGLSVDLSRAREKVLKSERWVRLRQGRRSCTGISMTSFVKAALLFLPISGGLSSG